MSKVFNIDGPVYSFFSKIADICILNLLWILTSIPLFTIGAATTALIRTMMKVVINHEGNLMSVYFSSFKANFKKSTIIWIIMAVIGALLVLDIYFWSDVEGTISLVIASLTIAIMIPYFMILLYVFALQGFFENSIKNTFKNSLLMAFKHFAQTLQLAFIIGFGYYVNHTIALINLITLIFGIGFIGFIAAKIYSKVFSHYVKKEFEIE